MRRLLVLAPLALALAACGGSGNGSGGTATTAVAAAGPLAGAAAKTQAAGSELMQLHADVTFSGSTFTLDGSGAFDNPSQLGNLSATIAVRNSGSTPIDEIFSGNTMWIDSPLFAAALPADKSWLEIDLGKEAAGLGFDFKALTGQNPGDVLGVLRRTSDRVTTLGKAMVGGVETTHYRAAVRPVDASQDDPVQQLTGEQFRPVDVWVDDHGLVRKVQLDYTAKTDPAKPGRAHVVLDMQFSHFGAKVSVMTPPSSDSVDAGNSGSLAG